MGIELLAIPIGIIIATIAMSIGLGGGIIWVPVMLWLYGLTPQEAVATSLVIQVAGLGSGTVAYLRAGAVRLKVLPALVGAALPSVIVGSILAVSLPRELVQGTLGLMSLALALIFVSQQEGLELLSSAGEKKSNTLSIMPIAGFFGFFSGFLSVGIGEWIIPFMKKRLRMQMYESVATAVTTMFILAITGSFTHGIFGNKIRWSLAAYAIVGVIIGAQIGPRISKRINDRALKEVFIYIMTLIGIHEIFQAL
ncbi:MAG: sulfite exporter TauE/SafE family protein [Acidobacteria bacterium]|nr:sulfite exporter TauE/SafE family protein [Acidobacteriota bacterium]